MLVRPLSEGRLRVPRRRASHIVRRPLLDALVNNLDRPVGLIVGPAGSGKTSLVVGLVAELGWPCAWYSAIAADADPVVVCSYLASALELALPGFGAGVRRLLDRAPGTGVPGAADLVAAIVDEIERAADMPFFLVVDDVSAIAGQPDVAAVIEQIVLQAPDTCHFLLTGRVPPRLRLTRLIAEGGIFTLGPADLRLTESEVAALIERTGSLPVGAPTAAELLAATEGWMTGVVLALPRLARAPTPRAALLPAVHLLTAEVLDALPQLLRRFAGDLTVLQTFNLDTCRDALGYPDAAVLIEQLETVSPFIERLDGEGDWFRLHQLFQTALIERRWREDPLSLQRTAQRAAGWALASGDVEEAIRLHALAGDHRSVAHLLDQHGLPLFEAGRLRQLADWLDGLPAETLADEPPLAVLRARIEVYLGDRTRALLRAERVLASGRLDPATEVAARLVAIAALWLTGQPDRALAECDRAAVAAADLADRRVGLEVARYRASVLGIAGRVGEALDQLLSIRDDPDQTEFARAIVDEQLGVAFAKLGDLIRSRHHSEIALRRWEELGNRLQAATTRVNLGVRCHELGDYVLAHEYLERALADAERTGHLRAIGFARASLADLLRAEGRFGEAEAHYQGALTIAQRAGESALVSYCLAGLARLALSQDNAAGAENWLRQADVIAQGIGASDLARAIGVTWGRLLLRSHLSETAVARVEEAATWLLSSHQEVLWSGACLWLAAARAAGGNLVGARQAWEAPLPRLRQAAEFTLDPVERREIERHLAGALGPRLTWAAPSPLPRRSGQATVRRLLVRSLGPTEVQLNGEPFALVGHRVLDLLLYLLLHPGGATREQLVARIWPDFVPTGQHNQFHSALIRIRRSLYPGVIQHHDGLYAPDAELVVEWDADRFEELARLIRGSNALTPVVAAAGRQIFELFRGDFLTHLEGDWQLARRIALHEMMVQTAHHLALLYLSSHAPDGALAVVERASAFAPHDEALCAAVLRALVAAGHRTDARRRWRAFIAELHKEFGVGPTPDFLALEQELFSTASYRSRRQAGLRARRLSTADDPPSPR